MGAGRGPAYDVEARPPDDTGLATVTMSALTAAHDLAVTLASASESGGGGEHESNHASLNPYFVGGSTLFILLLLLFITTRFNRDR